MEIGYNSESKHWEMKPIQIKEHKRKVLPYAALKREYLELPITNMYELYVYCAISAYCEYCGGTFKCTLKYLSEYYSIEIKQLRLLINELIGKDLIEVHKQNDGSYEFKTLPIV